MLKKILLLCGVALTVTLSWFGIGNYRAAFPLAEESLRGVALSMTAAVENMASHDPSLQSLRTFRPKDLAFLAIVDGTGTYRFHTNPDLTGSHEEKIDYGKLQREGNALENRVVLGTGEQAFEYVAPLHLPRETLILRLTLHRYRADGVIRRAELDAGILLSLVIAGWILSAVLYRYAAREERHRREMAQQESLVRLGEMGAMLAHEIRNPLGGIKGFAQIIEKKPCDDRNESFAHRIVAETLRLEALVNDLLSYTRSEPPSKQELRLDELVLYSVSLIRPEADVHGVRLEVAPLVEGWVTGDRDRLVQVLLNLMKNSVQAMPGGGTLAVGTGVTSDRVTITFEDTGEGIPQEAMDRIFDPFFTTRAKGTGLGLALCRKIVQEHQGTIRIESETGKGTTVTVSLPKV